jgi:hypothetical protein
VSESGGESVNAPTPNARYRHVFVIVRVDLFHGPNASPEDKVAVTKVFWTQPEAECEVQRLRDLNADKDCVYFWTTGRLVDEAQGQPGAQPVL